MLKYRLTINILTVVINNQLDKHKHQTFRYKTNKKLNKTCKISNNKKNNQLTLFPKISIKTNEEMCNIINRNRITKTIFMLYIKLKDTKTKTKIEISKLPNTNSKFSKKQDDK